MLNDLPLLLTVDETAKILRTTRKGIYAMVERGRLPGITRVGPDAREDERSVRGGRGAATAKASEFPQFLIAVSGVLFRHSSAHRLPSLGKRDRLTIQLLGISNSVAFARK